MIHLFWWNKMVALMEATQDLKRRGLPMELTTKATAIARMEFECHSAIYWQGVRPT